MRYKQTNNLPNLGRFEINVWDNYNRFLYYFWVYTDNYERLRRNSWHKDYVRYRPFNKKPFNQTQLLMWKIANKIAKQTREKNVEKD